MTEFEGRIGHTLSALSARMIALEGTIAAIAADPSIDRKRATIALERFAQDMFDRYVGLPVDETFIALLEQSFADARGLVALDD